MNPGTASQVRCSICMEYISSSPALLMPCTHSFDLSCISILLQSAGPIGRHCPLCRSRILEIHYNFNPSDGSYSTHIPGPTRPESPLSSGPFIREDEELREDMSSLERSRVLELRRLRGGEDYKLRVCLVLARTWVREGERFVVMSDCVDLGIDQVAFHACTSSSIKRKLSLLTRSIDPESEAYIQSLGPEDPDALARVRLKIATLLSKIGRLNEEFSKFQHTGLKYKIPYCEKGLLAMIRKSIKITKSEDRKEDIEIISTTQLNEVYQTSPPNEDPESANGIRREERERVIREAREEVQGAVEFVFVKVEGFRGLEGGMTGVLDVRSGWRCGVCRGGGGGGGGGGHRSGDCELSQVVEVVVGDGEVGSGRR